MFMSLKQINLTFNDTLIIQRQQAAQQHKSLSEMASLLLAQQLAVFNVSW
jgi:hypothetical protein